MVGDKRASAKGGCYENQDEERSSDGEGWKNKSAKEDSNKNQSSMEAVKSVRWLATSVSTIKCSSGSSSCCQ